MLIEPYKIELVIFLFQISELVGQFVETQTFGADLTFGGSVFEDDFLSFYFKFTFAYIFLTIQTNDSFNF